MHDLKIGCLMPMPGRGLIVAFERNSDPLIESTPGTDAQTLDFGLLKYTAAGRGDRA